MTKVEKQIEKSMPFIKVADNSLSGQLAHPPTGNGPTSQRTNGGTMPATAVILTNGHLSDTWGKTAHGLIRGSDRFNVIGTVDPVCSGRDAGEVLDGVHRGIPVYKNVAQMLNAGGPKPDVAIIGVALAGGRLPAEWKPLLLEVIHAGISLVAGLHVPLSSDPVLVDAAKEAGVELIDIRKPVPIEDLRFFSGEIYRVEIPRIAVLGTDCAVGKRTTCRLMMELCRQNGIDTEMIYTGQTGWFQGYPFGFILDATPNDFVSGEIERVIVECAEKRKPQLILLEGQSALRNPFGPCGSELILSGNVRHVVLQYAPFRTYFEDIERPECRIPSVQDEIELIGSFGARTIAICLNGEGGSEADLAECQRKLAAKLAIPVICPLEEGLVGLLPQVRELVA